MINQGENFGYLYTRLIAEVAHGVAGGTEISVSLDKLPCDAPGGLLPHVVGFQVVFPVAALTIAIGKVLDGSSLAQFLGTSVSMTLAANSPPTAFEPERGTLIKNMDGPRLLEALTMVSRLSPFRGAGGAPYLYDDTSMAAGSPTTAVAIRAGQRRKGHIVEQGPFGAAASGATQAWSAQPVLNLWIAHRDGEGEVGEMGIPVPWFTGKKKGGCAGEAPGMFTFTTPTTIDGAAVAYTAGNVQVFAILAGLPKKKTRVPPTLHLISGTSSESTLKAKRGIRGGFWLQKALAAGAQPAHDYTRVGVEVNGSQLFDQLVTRLIAQADMLEADPEYGYTDAETAYTDRMANRKSRWGVPVLLGRKSALRGPGSGDEQTVISLIETTETAHQYVDCTFTPVTDDVVRAAKQWTSIPDPVVSATGANGRGPAEAAAPLMPNSLIPAAHVDPKSLKAAIPQNPG